MSLLVTIIVPVIRYIFVSGNHISPAKPRTLPYEKKTLVSYKVFTYFYYYCHPASVQRLSIAKHDGETENEKGVKARRVKPIWLNKKPPKPKRICSSSVTQQLNPPSKHVERKLDQKNIEGTHIVNWLCWRHYHTAVISPCMHLFSQPSPSPFLVTVPRSGTTATTFTRNL